MGTLQSALDQAKSNPGPDQIRLGAGTYSGAFTYDDNGSSTNTVAITGLSSRSTTLTRSSGGTILTMTGAGNADNSVANLRFHITQSNSGGLSGGTADTAGVVVAADSPVTNSIGLFFTSGSARNVTVSMPVDGSTEGIASYAGGVFDSKIAADTAVSTNQGVVQRSDITGGATGITTTSGKVDDDVIHVVGLNSGRAGLVASNGGVDSGSAVARHLTILGDGNPGSTGIGVLANATTFPETEALDVRSTIIRSVAHAYRRRGTLGGSMATANLTMKYTNYDPATRDDSGAGTGPSPSDPTNPNTDPLFVDAAHSNFRLSFNSPMIDAGDPAVLAPDEPNTDFSRAARVVNGRTDIGAYEYQRRPPTITSATATPTAAQVGTPFSFTATATDPDADPITYAWSFDDGGSAPGASVQHAFANPGIHVATVTVTDAAGVSSQKAVAVAATSGPVPKLTALALVPKKFRPAKGADVRFTLTVGAPVRFTVERASTGRRVGGKCRAQTKKNRHAKKCTRYVGLKGSFLRNGGAGANHFHWNGRLKGRALKPGIYRLTGSVGSGLARNVRRAKFTVKH